MTDAERDALVATARDVLADQRFGDFSHPVALGLLLAIDVLSGGLDATGGDAPPPSVP